MSSPPRLGLIVLAVAELRRSVDFYSRAFGWEQLVTAPVYVEFRLPAQLRLGLYQRENFGLNTGRTPFAVPAGELAPTELYLFPDDLEAAQRRVEAAGARLLSALAPRAWGDEAAYYADPDGNVLVLARPA